MPAHFFRQRGALNGSHLFEILEGVFDCTHDGVRRHFINSAAGLAQGARQPRQRVDVHVAGEIEFTLNITERLNITGDQVAVDFICRFAGSFKIEADINSTTREARAD